MVKWTTGNWIFISLLSSLLQVWWLSVFHAWSTCPVPCFSDSKIYCCIQFPNECSNWQSSDHIPNPNCRGIWEIYFCPPVPEIEIRGARVEKDGGGVDKPFSGFYCSHLIHDKSPGSSSASLKIPCIYKRATLTLMKGRMETILL